MSSESRRVIKIFHRACAIFEVISSQRAAHIHSLRRCIRTWRTTHETSAMSPHAPRRMVVIQAKFVWTREHSTRVPAKTARYWEMFRIVRNIFMPMYHSPFRSKFHGGTCRTKRKKKRRNKRRSKNERTTIDARHVF